MLLADKNPFWKPSTSSKEIIAFGALSLSLSQREAKDSHQIKGCKTHISKGIKQVNSRHIGGVVYLWLAWQRKVFYLFLAFQAMFEEHLERHQLMPNTKM